MPNEIERKFLISFPGDDFLKSKSARILHITQTYLISPKDLERRVREITEEGKTTYIYTEKQHKTALTREENEREITKSEYTNLLAEAYSTLTKTRYTYPYKSHTIEIDLYPHEIGGDALKGKAVMEIELPSENTPVTLPDDIKVLRELTGTREFSNKTLAKKFK